MMYAFVLVRSLFFIAVFLLALLIAAFLRIKLFYHFATNAPAMLDAVEQCTWFEPVTFGDRFHVPSTDIAFFDNVILVKRR
jgi:hypothetical protein